MPEGENKPAVFFSPLVQETASTSDMDTFGVGVATGSHFPSLLSISSSAEGALYTMLGFPMREQAPC